MSTPDSVIKNANQFLKVLKMQCHPYLEVLGDVSQDDTLLKYKDLVHKSCLKAGLENPWGAVRGDVTSIFELVMPGTLPSAREPIIELLIETNRICKVGLQGGKALVLITDTFLSASEYIEKTVLIDDAKGLSKALRDVVGVMVQDTKELLERNLILNKQVDDLKKENSRLQGIVTKKYQTTWT